MTSAIFPFNLRRPALKVYHEPLRAFEHQITASLLESETDQPAARGDDTPGAFIPVAWLTLFIRLKGRIYISICPDVHQITSKLTNLTNSNVLTNDQDFLII